MTEQEYTPTWTEIETAYIASRLAFTDGNEDARAEEVHRWLAEHDRQVAENAWQDGAYWVADHIGDYPLSVLADEANPYREAR